MNKTNLYILLTLTLAFSCGRSFAQEEIIMGEAPTYTQVGEDACYFYDPGGVPTHPGNNNNALGYFDVNIKDTMSIKTNVTGSQLYVLFTSFMMGYGDTLYIFDGQDCTAPLIGTYNSVHSPGEITATGRWLTFVFHSDNVNDYADLSSGWQATMIAVMSNPQGCIHSHGQTYMTCNAIYYDQGGATGNIGVTSGTSWTEFTSPVGSHVKVHFTQKNWAGIMKIYDGSYWDVNKRLIGQFCTSTSYPPDVLISSGATLTFEYVAASGDANRPGWVAEVSCITDLFETPEGSACPSITIMAQDTEVVGDILFDCDNPVTILDASVVATGPYSYDYMVDSIPYSSRIFEYNIGTSLGASVDDDWINLSGTALPFTFSFFGNNYNRVWPGANGLISMTQPSAMYCSYNYPVPPTSPPYSSVPYVYKNCIYGVYEDIYPGHYYGDGNIRVGVQGTAPCRAFVFNYDRVGLFGQSYSSPTYCNTYQMVIYEGTNIIDVFVKYRKCCATTNNNNHEGIIGLQNNTSSQILIAPGRGMTGWEVLTDAQSEGWRFTPITPLDPNATVTWYQNSVDPDNVIGNEFKQVVSPQQTTRYIVEYQYTNAGGDHFSLRDTVRIVVNIPSVTASHNSGVSTCPGDNVQLNTQVGVSTVGVTPVSYLWSNGDTLQNTVVQPQVSCEYTVTVTFDNGCTNQSTTNIQVTEMDRPTITGEDHICFGESTTLTASHPDSEILTWSTGETTHSITVAPADTIDYVVDATLIGNCHTMDTFRVYVQPLPVPSFIASPTEIYVDNGVGTVTCTSLSDPLLNIVWNFGDMFSPENVLEDIQMPTHDYTHSGYYTITLTAIDSLGCSDSIKTRVSVTVPYFFYIPNAFTPDNNGVNERFAPQGEGVDPAHYTMLIYDRNGNILFKTTNPYDYWDGRDRNGRICPAGIYVYYILLQTLNGDTKEYNGSITLIK